MTIKIYSAYSVRPRVNNPVSGDPTPTKQEFKKEVNINEIVARMRRGISPPPWMTSATPRYGDFTNMPTSFQEAYALIETAEEAFRALPLEFRRAIDHNPANLEKAPRELYEQFGLLKNPSRAEEPSAPSNNTRRAGEPSAPSNNTRRAGEPSSSSKEGSPQGRAAGAPDAPFGANKRVNKPVADADE